MYLLSYALNLNISEMKFLYIFFNKLANFLLTAPKLCGLRANNGATKSIKRHRFQQK